MPLDPDGVYEPRADPALEAVLESYAGLLDMISRQEPHRMVAAALAYLVNAQCALCLGKIDLVAYAQTTVPPGWPYPARSWKPVSPRMDMVMAAALLTAEVKRMDDAANGVTTHGKAN